LNTDANFFKSCLTDIYRSIDMKRVLVGGVFSIIHPGHVFFLKKARSMGEHLTVILTHDRNVKKKGELLIPATERKKVLESIRYVDTVVIGDEADFFRSIKKARPDVIVIGYDQQFDMLWLRNTLKESGMKCQIVRLKESLGSYSTSRILDKLKAASANNKT
jgi:FAD synthetase